MALNNMAVNDLGRALTGDEQVRYNHEKYKDKFKDANADLVNAETFLTLLVAEMTNQDPLEPTSNTEFITQMAQFSQLQYLQDSSSYSMSNYASSLVGKTVTVSKMDGAEKVETSGVVTEVKKIGDEFKIVVNGVDFDLKNIQAIADTNTVTKPSDNTNIGDLIAKASSMIGLYAEVSTKVPDENAEGGVTEKKAEGFIEAVTVKDGAVKLVIGGENYDLGDIREVYPAVIVPEEPEKPDDGTDTDGGDDKVDTDNTVDTDTDNNTGTEDTTDKNLEAQSAAAAREMLHAVRHIEPENEGADLTDLNVEDIDAEL